MLHCFHFPKLFPMFSYTSQIFDTLNSMYIWLRIMNLLSSLNFPKGQPSLEKMSHSFTFSKVCRSFPGCSLSLLAAPRTFFETSESFSMPRAKRMLVCSVRCDNVCQRTVYRTKNHQNIPIKSSFSFLLPNCKKCLPKCSIFISFFTQSRPSNFMRICNTRSNSF